MTAFLSSVLSGYIKVDNTACDRYLLIEVDIIREHYSQMGSVTQF